MCVRCTLCALCMFWFWLSHCMFYILLFWEKNRATIASRLNEQWINCTFCSNGILLPVSLELFQEKLLDTAYCVMHTSIKIRFISRIKNFFFLHFDSDSVNAWHVSPALAGRNATFAECARYLFDDSRNVDSLFSIHIAISCKWKRNFFFAETKVQIGVGANDRRHGDVHTGRIIIIIIIK